MSSLSYAPKLPHDAAVAAVADAAKAFVEAGLSDNPRAQLRLTTEANAWRDAVLHEVVREWWDLWDEEDKAHFLGDMHKLARLYDIYDPRTGAPAPKHMPALSDPRLVCWTTLERMRSSLSRVHYIVESIAATPPPGSAAHLWSQSTGDWFLDGVIALITPKEFDAADEALRRRVVAEFERLHETLVEVHEQGRSMALPALSNRRWFRAFVLLLETNTIEKGLRKAVHLDWTYQSTFVSNELLRLAWWHTHPNRDKLQAGIKKTLKDLLKMDPDADDTVKLASLLHTLEVLRGEAPSPTPRGCGVQSLAHEPVARRAAALADGRRAGYGRVAGGVV